MTWQLRAACRDADPELFFPLGEGTELTDGQALAAKAVCARCPVARHCLAHALDAGEVGVWGGTTETERRAIRRVLRTG